MSQPQETMVESEPQIYARTMPLDLADSSLPPLVAHVTVLRDSLMVTVGSSATGVAIQRDMSCAMPPTKPGQTSAATTISGPSASAATSASNSASLSLSAKLSRRYARQVFLSLDLDSVARPGQGGDWALPMIERALVRQLDGVVGGRAST